MGAALIYQRSVIETLFDLVEYLTGETLFNGAPVFRFAESLYIKYFDGNVRQKVTYDVSEVVDYENPRVVGRNRRPAHALLRSFTSREECINYWSNKDRKISDLSNICFLTGEAGNPLDDKTWSFLLVGSPKACPKNWESSSYSAADMKNDKWTHTALPSHWQLQGHDVPIYTNTAYPFAFDPPRARRTGQWVMTGCDMGLGADAIETAPLHPKEPGENATGLYRRSFTLPTTWGGGGRTFLVFEGVDSCVNVWVDGVYVGFSKDSCLPAEFDLTHLLLSSPKGKGGKEQGGGKEGGKEGEKEEHILAVQVMRWCDGSYVEDQDKWWLSGIYREVYLQHKPACFIADYEFTTDITIPLIKKGKEGTNMTQTYPIASHAKTAAPSPSRAASRQTSPNATPQNTSTREGINSPKLCQSEMEEYIKRATGSPKKTRSSSVLQSSSLDSAEGPLRRTR